MYTKLKRLLDAVPGCHGNRLLHLVALGIIFQFSCYEPQVDEWERNSRGRWGLKHVWLNQDYGEISHSKKPNLVIAFIKWVEYQLMDCFCI